MDKNLVNEIINCLPKERTIFRYFKGRYALMLLDKIIGEGEAVSKIKKTSFSSLLDKPEVKQALAMAGQGIITPKMLENVWLGDTYHFILTTGIWGNNDHRWDQTTRRGHNLVLRLNFSNQHDGLYNKMVKPEYESLLNPYGHPVLDVNDRSYFRETLAWSRIDLDFQKNQALIEEVQNDWLREANDLLKDAIANKQNKREMASWWGSNGKLDDIIKYCQEVLRPYYKFWDEAMLAATIDFIRHELGITNIYYHSEETGHKLKGIRYTKPPRSLYSKLPRKFCFTKTDQAPDYLYQDAYFRRVYKKVDNPQWYRMAI